MPGAEEAVRKHIDDINIDEECMDLGGGNIVTVKR